MNVQSTCKICDSNPAQHSPFDRVDARGVGTALIIASLVSRVAISLQKSVSSAAPRCVVVQIDGLALAIQPSGPTASSAVRSTMVKPHAVLATDVIAKTARTPDTTS